jgi:hypothetical protein
MHTYPILHITAEDVIGDEQLGTKTKFWFQLDGKVWLFKEARTIKGDVVAGEDWAEKVAAEIAQRLGIPAAVVELAEFQGRRGCAALNFVAPEQQLMHGNEILANYVAGYDRDKRFGQRAHTLENIVSALRQIFDLEANHRIVFGRLILL